MPRPSLSNRGNFKAYLRHFKAKFNGNLQKLPEYWIDAILSTKAAGISTTTDVNVVIFDNKDTVDITTATNNNELIYIPALPGDEISLKIGSSVATLSFDAEGDPVTFKGTTYNLNDTIPTNIGGKNLVVKGLGGALLQPSSAPTYSVGISTGIVNEGSSVDITVNTTDVGAGTTAAASLGFDGNLVGIGTTNPRDMTVQDITFDGNSSNNIMFEVDSENNLLSFANLSFHKGWIPEIFLSLPEDKWSYVHIDVDLYRPTLDSLEYFFPRMAAGGVIINDDYSSPLFPGGGSGWEEFFNKVKKPYIVLDTGQAVFINK